MKRIEKKLFLSEIIDMFIKHCIIEKHLDEKTIKAYKTDLFQLREIINNIPIVKLSKDDIREYLQKISHYSHKTIKRKIASLRAMLNYYECENESYINPMRRMQIRMREPFRLPEVMTIEEVGRIVADVRSCYGQDGRISHLLHVRNIAIIELLFASGIRVSELCNLRMRDVDLSAGRIRIIGKRDKERIVDICQEATINSLTEWANMYKETNTDAPFFISRLHNKLSPQSVRALVRQLRTHAGINKHITPHTFRHTYATLLLEEDVDITYIQHLLGHSSISTTQIYTHVNLQKQHEIILNKHPRRLL